MLLPLALKLLPPSSLAAEPGRDDEYRKNDVEEDGAETDDITLAIASALVSPETQLKSKISCTMAIKVLCFGRNLDKHGIF